MCDRTKISGYKDEVHLCIYFDSALCFLLHFAQQQQRQLLLRLLLVQLQQQLALFTLLIGQVNFAIRACVQAVDSYEPGLTLKPLLLAQLPAVLCASAYTVAYRTVHFCFMQRCSLYISATEPAVRIASVNFNANRCALCNL